MVPPGSDRVPPAPPYSGCGLGWTRFRIRGCHPLRRAFPGRFRYRSIFPCSPPCNPGRAATRPVWALPLSLAATRGVTVVFLSSAYLDVSVRRVSLRLRRMARLPRAGFPHSDIRGSQAVRASPRLFAACRVLPRLREPWHPPCALRYLSRTAPVRRFPAAGPSSILALEVFSFAAPFYGAAVLDCVFSCLSFHPVKEPPPHRGMWRIRESNP